METIWLYTYPSGEMFAFSSDNGAWWYTKDGKPWAWSNGDEWLWPAHGGQAIGYFSGNTFYNTQGKPLYFRGE